MYATHATVFRTPNFDVRAMQQGNKHRVQTSVISLNWSVARMRDILFAKNPKDLSARMRRAVQMSSMTLNHWNFIVAFEKTLNYRDTSRRSMMKINHNTHFLPAIEQDFSATNGCAPVWVDTKLAMVRNVNKRIDNVLSARHLTHVYISLNLPEVRFRQSRRTTQSMGLTS